MAGGRVRAVPRRLLVAAAFALLAPPAPAGPPADPLCIAPAKANGGFDLTCRLAQKMLAGPGGLAAPLRIAYLPGGIGAVAFNQIVYRRPAEPGTIVAFSGGSLLNLAMGKYGQHTPRDVRWLASIAADHGVVVVNRDSPIRTLRDLEAMLKRDPSRVRFGGGGTVGSQDWLKAAILARAMGVDYKSLRFVSFEGGGDALEALGGQHLEVVSGDVAETQARIDAGKPLRIVAVYSRERLPGRLHAIPTAVEQGYDMNWRTVRGFYMGPGVDEADVRRWAELLRKAGQAPGYAELLQAQGLQPFVLVGPELDAYVMQASAEMRQLARQFGLRKNASGD